MSDHVDNTDKIIFAEVKRGLAAVRSRPALVAHGCCHYCDERLAPGLPFCGPDCRDDYDKEQAAKARAGRTRWPPRRVSWQGRGGDSPAVPDCPSHRTSRPRGGFFHAMINDVVDEAIKSTISARRAQLSPIHTCPLYRALLTQICAMAEGA